MLSEQLVVDIKPGGGRRRPYHRQIYEQLRKAILDGRLRPGERLPATRDLAARLGLARNTVARAYDDLLTDGFLRGRVGSGTFVALAVEPRAADEGAPGGGGETGGVDRHLTPWGRAILAAGPRRGRDGVPEFDFRPGNPDWETFPRALWLRLLGRALRREASELTRYGDPAGYYPLREAVARHLGLSRGVAAGADQVVIVGGSQQALDLLARLHVGRGDAVAVEDPGYPEASLVFAAAGARLVPVPVDADGPRVEDLVARTDERAPRIVYVTPSHQFPTGATLSLGRRLALLEWAARREVLVVEDDYDSEFHYSERPVPSLQGLDRGGRVLYLGTFSTVLFPPLRVGYIVLPPDLVRPVVQAKWLADRQTPMLEQLALADFVAEGHFARHLRRMRRLAAERRATLLAAIAEEFGPGAVPSAAGSGMHALLRFPRRMPSGPPAAEVEAAISGKAAEMGVGVYPLAPCCLTPSAEPALLLGFAALPPERIREGIRRLARAVEQAEVRW